jgi:LuxR family quorum-sensing system transcriptional regulator SinR
MGWFDAYFDLLDWLDQRETLDAVDFLSKLQAAYQIGPVTHLGGLVASGRILPRNISQSRRHNPQNLARNLNRKPVLDQIARVLSSLEPIELVSWQRPASIDQSILGYPLPGRQACLLVEIRATPEALAAWRRRHDRDMLSLGTLLNARLVRASMTADEQDRARARPLTRRERETLAWIAAGKSYWETAVILGISERTIRHFMANAREKLDVVNNAQAVAEAVWRGLIPRLADQQTP